MNLLPATVAGPDLLVHGQRLPVPPGVVPGSDGTELTVGIRPEYLALMVADRAGPIGRDTGALHGGLAILQNLGTAPPVPLQADGVGVAGTAREGDEPPVGARARAVPTPAGCCSTARTARYSTNRHRRPTAESGPGGVGRAAISATRTGPLRLRVGPDLVALGSEGPAA